jgi:BirA family biotin operon repressor/biotin-[acetyl-CoA-carboxylase] ligase
MAKELAMSGAREGTVVTAETQAKGRGRLRRKWISLAGGLWLSIVLRPGTELKHVPKLTLMVSVAVVKTLSKLFGLKAQIKWPNDVLIEGKKVSGILTEAKTEGETLDFVVVGIGINTNFNVNSLPLCLQDSSTTLKEELRKEVERESLLCMLLKEIESYYHLFRNGEFSTILNEWRGLAGFLGSYVRVVSHGDKIEGQAIDIDEDGALIVKLEDQAIRKVTSGDLTLLRMKR